MKEWARVQCAAWVPGGKEVELFNVGVRLVEKMPKPRKQDMDMRGSLSIGVELQERDLQKFANAVVADESTNPERASVVVPSGPTETSADYQVRFWRLVITRNSPETTWKKAVRLLSLRKRPHQTITLWRCFVCSPSAGTLLRVGRGRVPVRFEVFYDSTIKHGSIGTITTDPHYSVDDDPAFRAWVDDQAYQ